MYKKSMCFFPKQEYTATSYRVRFTVVSSLLWCMCALCVDKSAATAAEVVGACAAFQCTIAHLQLRWCFALYAAASWQAPLGAAYPRRLFLLWVMGGLLYRECVTECVRGVASATPIFQVLFHKTSSPKALKPLSPQALMPSNLQTHKFSNLQGLKQNSQFPSSTQTLKPSSPHAHKPKSHQILKSSSPLTLKPTYPKALKV